MNGASFEFSQDVALFLPIFDVTSVQGLVLACCIFAVLTMSYEGFKCLRLTVAERGGDRWDGISPFSKTHVYSTLMFTLELLIGYTLMLTVMTFNAWLFLSILLGSAVGYGLCSFIDLRHRFQIVTSRHVAGGRTEAPGREEKDELESIEMLHEDVGEDG